jgi:hypothetical protein
LSHKKDYEVFDVAVNIYKQTQGVGSTPTPCVCLIDTALLGGL